MTLPGGSATAVTALSHQMASVMLKQDFDLLPYVLDMVEAVEKTKDQREELIRKVCY